MSIITEKAVVNTVIMKNGKEVVRSDKLAKVFEKEHKNVLAIIQRAVFDIICISEELTFPELDRGTISSLKGASLNKFKATKFVELEAKYLANTKLKEYFLKEVANKVQGGSFTRYYLTRKGFDLVALSLSGNKAFKYKLWYIDAFHDMADTIKEHKLIAKVNMSDDLWLQFRSEGKVFRNKLTKSIQDTVIPQRELESKFNDGRYYYHYTKLIYTKLGIYLPKGANPRDILDKRMLVRLEDLEDLVADMIVASTEPYKDTFKTIKNSLLFK